MQPGDEGAVFRAQAAPFEEFLTHLTPKQMRNLGRLSDELAVRLDRFAADCADNNVPNVQIRPARLALATWADQVVRQRSKADLTAWSGHARQSLFEGRDIGKSEIMHFANVAKEQGSDFADLAAFLDHCQRQMSDMRQVTPPKRGRTGISAVLVMLVLLTLGVGSYAAYLEARFHRQALDAYAALEDELTGGITGQSAQVVEILNTLSGDLVHVRAATTQAPLRGMITLPFADAVGSAQMRYQETVSEVATPLLGEAIELALATEGQGLALYDTIRAHGILTGLTAWEPHFLAGWVAAREEAFGLQGFADHVALIPGPVTDLPPPDPLIMEQARGFAAETEEADRAWLEMLRAPDIAELPVWDAQQSVPRLGQVAYRRSGAPLQVAGLYTIAGWEAARDVAAGVAVQKTRDLALPLFGQDLPRLNNTPDLVLARQQAETIRVWQDWLSDLRVLPFDEPQTAIIVSGTLSQAQSPLPALLEEVWLQVGGTDRARPRPLLQDVARTFGPMIQYVEQGRMDEIAALFASVNVALSTRDLDQARGDDAIMSVATRAQSIQSLRAAPRVVALLVEDTLAQISGGNADDTPLGRAWTRVHAQCTRALTGRFPFGEGPPVTPSTVEQMLGPAGAIPVFFRQFAAPNLDTEISPWRWKTEARFAGLSPDTAAFLEQAMTISAGMFEGGTLGADVTITTLAERGSATLRLGGVEVPMGANTTPAPVDWPGPAAAQGIALQFVGAEPSDTLTRTGPWGMLRLLDDLRLRPRDEGRRFLVDMRDATGRLFVELSFADPINPVSVRQLMQTLQCPDQL
ncbi:ImcF-related family protein [Cognatiyoonia sp. IB215446]|uniref:ImcF-related family protein n=1 Tax=Cognatiyoonia sp. IB215446 TaxID=3097355 RepID=UPI002A1836B6|nr:ImcF-related family protein [Cognatiyoonia sp. IB215446]MDX8346592.1 ImcF-related family protein [Cognatiyoonia sp. IB215446]